jgi:hypothetical protein
MKFYGTVYKGLHHDYNINGLQAYNNPYDALIAANAEWTADPHKQIARLLTVIQISDETGAKTLTSKAFFQFTDSRACIEFVRKQSVIKWGTDTSQNWNGNANLMG